MTILVTGFPTSFLAARVVRQLLVRTEHAVRCVVPARFMERARALLCEYGKDEQARVELLEGDVTSMDMGLSGTEWKALAREVRVIHHCAAATYLGVEKNVAQRLNIEGVREVLELAESAHDLERLVHWSSALVHGSRRGVVRENELVRSTFRNVVEETRFRGEELVQQAIARGLRATVLRPSILVGDSKSGEIDRFEGPYLLVLLMLATPVDLRVPLPGRGEVPLNLVPIDYVIDAGFAIAANEASIGGTFHLVDPRPGTARTVFARIAAALGKPSPRGSLPTQLAMAVLRTPGLERIAHVPRTFLEQLAVDVTYDDANTRALLVDSGIRCPPFEQYVDGMVDYVRHQHIKSKEPEIVFPEADEDPTLDPLS